MPRPKRSKVITSAPTPENATVPSNRILKDVWSPHSSTHNTTNSDDSEGLITTIKRNIKFQYTAPEEISMSGALASDDVKGSTRLRPSRGRQRAALSRIAREADHVRAIEGLKKRRDEALAKEKAPKMAAQEIKLQDARDEILVPSSMPGAEEIAQVELVAEDILVERRSVERVKPASFSTRKLPATPIVESSMLALANFKRRPRQPSILQIGRQDDAASESELDDMLNDFHPDDESTPFHVTKLDVNSRPLSSHPANTPLSTTSSSLDRQLPSSRKRKLTPPNVQVRNSQLSPNRLSSSPSEPANEQTSHSHISPEVRLYESDPELPSNTSRMPHAETIWSDTMAPPESSSPPQSPAKSSTTKKAGFRRKGADRELKDRRASTSVPPKSKSQPLKSISTATLQSLLPRRHHRPAKRASGDFDIQDSSDVELDTPEIAEDEDELSFAAPTGRKRVSTRSRKSMKSMKPAATVKKKKPSKPAQRAHSKDGGKGSSVVKTYSRHLSDKENRSADSDSAGLDESVDSPLSTIPDKLSAPGGTGKRDEAMPAKARTELKTLAKKFKEVDKWEMEFEEVTASSSSPWDAR
ncbi:hypothetical protein MMC32_006641 [Xylographa parallela]|nr:hypothetical protein [Xylographa parallela]